ncbi:MAG: FadR family transcriptional regulator [Firmicutes bacterium]|nr:FadR family transcriptional regulator [Bacillota bacterium]
MEDVNFLSKEERYDVIVDQILNMIYEGDIKSGDKMYSENQMAKKLGVSRAHIREVYSALSIIGVLESRRGEGTFLKSAGNSAVFKILMLMLYDDSLSMKEMIELRKVIEVYIAEKAATNRTEKDIRDMRRCIQAMENCNDSKEMSALDTELHSLIGRSCGSNLLMNLSRIVSGLVMKIIEEHWQYIIGDKNVAAKQKKFEQHRDLVDAIANKKPYIAKVIAQEHLEYVAESLERYGKEANVKKDAE